MTAVGPDGRLAPDEVTPVERELGKYKLLALIGRGGMGDIYLAMARGPAGFKKLVVIKCLRAGSEEDEPLRQMLIDEGKIAARLNHPHVVQTYEVGESNGTQYMAMEYLDGQALSRIRRAVDPFDPRLAARIASDALAGLHYAHELRDFDGTPLGIVHRDLSPPNIFVTYDGVVKLVDFGIAKTQLASRAMTEVGVLKGKIGYMAPEQISRDNVDRRADIFGMGVVLWELLAGRRLVQQKTPVASLRFLLNGVIPRVSSIRPDIDPTLDAIVARALERPVEARYQTALEMRNELEDYIAGSGRAVRDEQLGQLVSTVFAGSREQRTEQIQDCIAASNSTGKMRVLAPTDAVSTTGSYQRAFTTGQTGRGAVQVPLPEVAAPARAGESLRARAAKKAQVIGVAGAVAFGLVCWITYFMWAPAREAAVVGPTTLVNAGPPASDRVAPTGEQVRAAVSAEPIAAPEGVSPASDRNAIKVDEAPRSVVSGEVPKLVAAPSEPLLRAPREPKSRGAAFRTRVRNALSAPAPSSAPSASGAAPPADTSAVGSASKEVEKRTPPIDDPPHADPVEQEAK